MNIPITDCGKLTLDFMQLGLWASPPFLQTLGPWFPNEIQNLLSSEKRTLDHWATVQFFFSLAQVRHLWHCLWFRSGLTRGILIKRKKKKKKTATWMQCKSLWIKASAKCINVNVNVNMTTVAKFLDTSVCGGSWCLDPSLSPFLVKFTQILESILLDNPHKAAVLGWLCIFFFHTFSFHSTFC